MEKNLKRGDPLGKKLAREASVTAPSSHGKSIQNMTRCVEEFYPFCVACENGYANLKFPDENG